MHCFNDLSAVNVGVEWISDGGWGAVVFQVKSQQAEVIRILESKSIQYELIDISVGGELRDEMRSKAGNPTAVPPQLFNEDTYCGVRETPLSYF